MERKGEKKEVKHHLTHGEVYQHLVARCKKSSKVQAKVKEIAKHHEEGNKDKVKELTKDLVKDELFDHSVELATGVDATGLLTLGKMCLHASKGDSKKVVEDAFDGARSFLIIKTIVVAGACVGCRIF